MLSATAPGRMIAGRRYAGHQSKAGTDLTLTANRLYAVPWDIERLERFDRLEIKITALAAFKNMRVAVYLEGFDGLPGARLNVGFGFSVATTGVKAVTIALLRPPGRIFLAFIADGTPDIETHETLGRRLLGYANTGDDAASYLWRNFTFPSLMSDFPDPFGGIGINYVADDVAPGITMKVEP